MENQFKGKWWLPNNSDKDGISGELTVSYFEQSKLLVNGALSGTRTLEAIKGYDIVLGKLNNGKDVTLVKCDFSGSIGNNEDRIVETQFYIKYVLIGEHFDNIDNLMFDTYAIDLIHLNQWLGLSVIESTLTNICTKKIDPIKLLNNKECNINIYLNANISIKKYDKYEIKQNNNIIIVFNNNKTIKELKDMIYKLQCLFTLLTNEKH